MSMNWWMLWKEFIRIVMKQTCEVHKGLSSWGIGLGKKELNR